MSPLKFCRCCAGALLSNIGRLLIFFAMASEAKHRGKCDVWVWIYTWVQKNATAHSQKLWSFEIIVFKSAGALMVSFPIQLEDAVFIITPSCGKYKPSVKFNTRFM